jgi:NAD(P)-dependent dehydrogenase (short-subunit alcohol dehydrogenase family)
LNGKLEKAKSMDQFRLDGKAALITGGNRGIGLAIARLFGEAGAKCMLTARQQTAEVNELVARSPDCFAFIDAVATDPEAPARLVSATVETFGRLDILVNNAGISVVGDVDKFDDETLERIFSTNVTSCFRFTRSALKRMCEQGAGNNPQCRLCIRRDQQHSTKPGNLQFFQGRRAHADEKHHQ